METSAISKNKIEVEQIQIAIQQLIESQQSSATEPPITLSDEEHQLLDKLLSQLKSLKEDEAANQSEPPAEPKQVPSGRASELETEGNDEDDASKSNTGVGAEEVVKQLKKMEKQNKTTHWLITALIVLTVAWQVSEVSLLLKLKDGLTHPLKSVGNVFAGMIKRPKRNEDVADKGSLFAKKTNDSENPLNITNMDFSGLINGDEE
ncbi:hypothetical protein BVRB_6g150580 [Beta vulgaris subsp. vulgaris]|nr:hypothetical protein BVRB_6g150580 [Beta vulgaris subsp. vulgaris]